MDTPALSAAFTRALGETFHTHLLQLTFISTAVPNVTRSYDSEQAACQEVVDAQGVARYPLPHRRRHRCADGSTDCGLVT